MKRWIVAVVVVALGLAVALGWGWRSRPLPRDPAQSVLLISIDTLRADAVGAYGNPRAETPLMDRLAREGVRFDRAHAHNVITLPSHANILSGRYPLFHGVRDNSGFRFPSNLPTLASLLRERGYRTGAFVSAFPLDARFGLATGFEVYDDHLAAGGEWQASFVIPERRGADTVAAAVRWLDRHRGEKTFCFVHVYEPHFPYQPPEPFATRFAGSPYHGEVAASDAALEALLRPIFEAGTSGRTLVILTADHGEGLGDHGEATHGVFAYESTLRVPLIIWAPRLFHPAVVRTPVRHIDLVPTVLDIVGATAPSDLLGRSLLPLLAGRGQDAESSYFEALSPSLNRGWAPLHGVEDGLLKYIDLPIAELYDLASDPQETRDLTSTRRSDVERLRKRLAAVRQSERSVERVKEDAETVERLRTLGYAGAGSVSKKSGFTESDDPKRLIDLDTEMGEMLRLYHAGEIDRAIAVGRRLIARRPDMPIAHLQMAYLERERGNFEGAIAAARRAVELRPGDSESLSLLGTYLNEAGRAGEVVSLLEPAARQGDPDLDIVTAYAMALAAIGRRPDALVVFGRARESHPGNATVLVNIGTIHLMGGEMERARQAFEAALDIDPGQARAHNSLGVIALRERRLPEALEHWKRAVALNPEDYQTLYNLGTVLWDAGRREEARGFLDAYLRHAPPALEVRDIARVRALLRRVGGTGR